jgi:hypothetical protein
MQIYAGVFGELRRNAARFFSNTNFQLASVSTNEAEYSKYGLGGWPDQKPYVKLEP